MAARPQSSRSRKPVSPEFAELEAARRELEASRARREAADLAVVRRELEESRRRLQGEPEQATTYRRPPKAELQKRRARAKAAKRSRRRARA
jgi:hypothetical protein